MSSLGGPSIVTSGLVLHLDASNIKSYPGEETVNLITNPIPTSTSNFVVQGGIGTSTYDSTINAVRWVRTSYETWGAFYHNSSLANYLFDTSATYSISFKWKYGPSHSGTYQISFNIVQNNGQNTIMGNYVLTTYSTLLSDGWYYFKTSGIPANAGITQTGLAPGFRIITASQSGITDIYWKNLQFEKKTYATPFVNGTRGTTVATGGGLADRSGNSNHGEVINGPTYNSLKGGSIVFDGVDDYVNFTSNIDFADSVEFSVETVISIPTFVQTLSRVHWLSGSGGNSMMMFRASDFYMWNEAGGINGLQISYTFNINTIYHVIVTRNVSNNVSLYVNGVFINSGSRSGQFKWSTMGRLGAGSTTYCSKFTSYFNRVYNRALSTTEVLQNYNATKSRFI